MTASSKTQDHAGTAHDRRCWSNAETALSEELATQGLFDTIEYIDSDATDYRIPEWSMTEQQVVAVWLSDGTVSCICD